MRLCYGEVWYNYLALVSGCDAERAGRDEAV